jgi:hypothetical protein
MDRAAAKATADIIKVIRALTGSRRRRDDRVRLIERADSERCFDELLDCVSRTGGQWRCQRLVVGDGDGGRLPGMCVETRVTVRPLPPVCVVDDAFVAVPSNEPGASRYVVVESLPVVRAFAALHECAWTGARSGRDRLRDREHPDESPMPAHLLEILGQAASGATDLAARRHLKLSSRTYSRRMSELLAELDARSRFQAGIIAARRGLV